MTGDNLRKTLTQAAEMQVVDPDLSKRVMRIGQRRRQIRLAAVSVLASSVLAGAVASAAWLRSGDDGDALVADDRTGGRALLVLDDLGGGSPRVRVYVGPGVVEPDRTSLASFDSGTQFTAQCKVEGREVSSNPEAGEEDVTSSWWIRIATVPLPRTSIPEIGRRKYEVAYASWVYAHLETEEGVRVDLSYLPNC